MNIDLKTTSIPFPTRRKWIDWAGVHADYRAGVMTNREIGRQHGCSHVAVGKKASAEGWTRDLSERVRARAAEKVTKSVTSEMGGVTDNLIVEANADIQASVIRDHSAKIRFLHAVFDQLIGELEATAIGHDELARLAAEYAELQAGNDSEARDEHLKDLFLTISRLPGIGGRALTLKTLVDTLKTLVGLERQAFGIDEAVTPENAIIAALREIRGIT